METNQKYLERKVCLFILWGVLFGSIIIIDRMIFGKHSIRQFYFSQVYLFCLFLYISSCFLFINKFTKEILTMPYFAITSLIMPYNYVDTVIFNESEVFAFIIFEIPCLLYFLYLFIKLSIQNEYFDFTFSKNQNKHKSILNIGRYFIQDIFRVLILLIFVWVLFFVFTTLFFRLSNFD